MIIRLALIIALLFKASILTATTLSSISFKEFRDKTTVYCKLSDLPRYHAFSMDAPSRFVIDFQKTVTTPAPLQKNFSNQVIKKTRIGRSKNKTTRIVFDLRGDFPVKFFWIRAQKNKFGVLHVEFLNKKRIIRSAKKQPNNRMVLSKKRYLIQSKFVKNTQNSLHKPSRDVVINDVVHGRAVLQEKEATCSYCELHPWTMSGGIGYTWYQFGYSSHSLPSDLSVHKIGDGQTAFGRFAFGRELLNGYRTRLGLELGVQSGNIQRLDIPQDTLNQLAGLPIQANIKPMVDILLTGTMTPFESIPAYAVLKLGVAYRRMQINERITVNDVSQGSFEVQAGLGSNVSDRFYLALLYQGIINGNSKFTVNAEEGTGHISNIPSQNGLLLNLTYKL